MIKVVIVEDSPVAREFLTYILTSDPEIRVVGVAHNGVEALDVVRQRKPDVITMDIHMPMMDGFEATRQIMERNPTPIVIVSASTGMKEVHSTFRAIEAGALAVVLRPPGTNHALFESATAELIRTVKLMSEIKVVRKLAHPVKAAISDPKKSLKIPAKQDVRAVAIGASTGGPMALQRILKGLPKDFPLPLLIVQHIASGFVNGLVDWLVQTTGYPLHVAVHGEAISPRNGYVAPDSLHMGVDTQQRIILSDEASDNGLRPSVSHLFRSAALAFGCDAVGVLLTGMGRDGANELLLMKEKGAITIAQDKESSVVHGMPGEAVALDAATYVLSPDEIVSFLVKLSSDQYVATRGR